MRAPAAVEMDEDRDGSDSHYFVVDDRVGVQRGLWPAMHVDHRPAGYWPDAAGEECCRGQKSRKHGGNAVCVLKRSGVQEPGS